MQASESQPADISQRGEQLAGRAEQLRALGLERIVSALCAAAQRLRGDDELARETRQRLQQSTQLHAAMIEWGLATTLATVEPGRLWSLAAPAWSQGPASAANLVAVVLAGNLFTASVRALFLPLLAGAPVLAKASTADPVLALALKQALDAEDPDVGAHCEVLVFDRQHDASLQALLAHAQVVAVYGSDQAVAAIAARLPRGKRLIAHGHGVSTAFVTRDSLRDSSSVDTLVEQLALDVAAYDQLGCLSPHFVWVQEGGTVSARGVALALHERGLPALERVLPRGPLQLSAQAAEMQWRGAAAAQGELYVGHAHSVSYEEHSALRPSPGYRNISVHPCSGAQALVERLSAFGPQLKSIGVTASAEGRRELSSLFVQLGRPRICRVGQMQTPHFDAAADGRPALYGLVHDLAYAGPLD